MDEGLLAERLAHVRENLAAASAASGFPEAQLVVVTKTHPVADILPLRALGVTAVGENRVQEIREKLPELTENFAVHLIGRLQSNKVKYIIDRVCLIQSLDRWTLAEEIDRQAGRHGLRMPVLVQVSPAGEPQKGGLPPEETEAFIRRAASLPGLEIRGLMAVMPNTRDQALLRRLFTDMRRLYDRLREKAPGGVALTELSMGMSGDYALAAACGSTMVRVGSAIMGPRTLPRADTDTVQTGDNPSSLHY